MSIETRIQKLESSRPIDAVAEAAIVMKQIERGCAGLPDSQMDAKIAAILKHVPDGVLAIIANLPTPETGDHE